MADEIRIAAVTDDGQTISAHFGRATHYAVLTVSGGQIVSRELREKPGHHTFGGRHGHGHDHHEQDHEHGHAHQDGNGHDGRGHGFGAHAAEKHARMVVPIADCQVLLARGMGQGAFMKLQREGIRPILTHIRKIEEAVRAVADGTMVNHLERLH